MNNVRKVMLLDILKSSIIFEFNEVFVVQKFNGVSLVGDFIFLVVQLLVIILIDVGGELELFSEVNGEGMFFFGVLEVNNLFEIVRGCVFDLVEGRMDEKMWDLNM